MAKEHTLSQQIDKLSEIPLSSVIERIIWLCMLPLFLFAAGMAIYQIRVIQHQQSAQAAVLAENFILKVDNALNTRINALNILAVSPLVDDRSRWNELHQEAQGFYQSFGTHVVITDGAPSPQLLLNTRVPYGTKLPVVKKTNGRLAGPISMRTGKPAVSDLFPGPVANKLLIGIAVPVLRNGKAKYAILTILEKQFFQKRIEQIDFSPGWFMILKDAEGETIASRPPNPTDVSAESFVAKSNVSNWTVTVEIPHDAYWWPLIFVAVVLGAILLGVTLAGFLGGKWAGRRLGRAVASLAKTPAPGEPPPDILEIAVVRHLLDDEAQRRATVENTLRESQEALLEQREWLRVTLASIGDAVIATDTEGRITFMNSVAGTLTGWSIAEAVGNPLKKVFPIFNEYTRETVDDPAIMVLQSGKIVGLANHTVLLCRDGKEVPIDDSGAPIRDEKGHIQGVVLVFRDITDRQQSQKEQEKLQQQLIQAQKMESVGRLAGGVAHDFNNMLGIILGHAELGMDQVDHASPLRANLHEIQMAAQRSANLTRQLLAFARKQTVSPQVLDLNDTVKDMIKMLRRLIGEDIDLAWIPEANLWPVKIDPAQTDQLLANLCVNARDAISGVGKITIETKNIVIDDEYCGKDMEYKPGDYVMLAISDDGCGIDKETLDHIFEPFFTTKEAGKGTGLGLATVYGIVKQNGGFLNVYSEPGQGASFKIFLPRILESVAEKRSASVHSMEKGSETVLLVEDEGAILHLVKSTLERLGYKVLTFQSPTKALSMVEKQEKQFDLLITDVVMPDMNGRQLEKEIKKHLPNVKVLFMSGYTADAVAHRGILEADVQFLQKPFSNRTLAHKVRGVLDREY